MNRIYKVIWNKARGLYVVVSELAKAQGKSSRSISGRKTTVLALALAMTVFSGYGVSEAAIGSDTANAPGGHITVLTGNTQDAESLNKVIDAADTLVDSAEAIKDKADQSALDQEIADRKAADASQQAQIDAKADQSALDAETAARTAEDQRLNAEIVKTNTVLGQVSDNLGQLNQNVYDGFTAINARDDAQQTRIESNTTDIRTVSDAVSDTLKLDGDNYVERQTYDPAAKTFSTERVTEMNVNGDINADKDVTAGRNVAAEQDVTAARNMKAEGNISAGGNLDVTNNGTIGGNLQVNGNTITNGTTTTGGLTVNGASTFNGTATVNGSLTAQDGTFSGDVSGKSLHSETDITANGDITASGDISGKNINVSGDLDVNGKTTTGSLDVTGNSTVGGNLEVGGTSTFKDDAVFEKDVTVEGQLNVGKLHIATDANNYTDIEGGKVTSVNNKVDKTDGTVHTSVSTFDENGSNIAVNNGTTKTQSTQTADGFSESMSGNGSTDQWSYSRDVFQNAGEVTVSEAITGTDGKKANTEEKTSESSTSTVTDGSGASTFRQRVDEILAEIKAENGAGTSIQQTVTDITNTAKDGTITNNAKDLVNNAVETISNTAKNIENTATEGIKNSADTITNEAKTSITDKVGDISVTTTKDGTVFSDGAGTTTIKGNTITTGTVNANDVNVANKTTTKELKVMESASIAKDLTVGGNTTVSGDVTANSYKVGDRTYIDGNGINANDQKIVNVAPGEISADSTDAVNGSQLHATNERVGQVEQRTANLEHRVSNLDDRVDKVGASAAAMANLHPQDFDEDSKLSIAAAVGTYRSETAGAVGLFYRPTDRVMLNVSTSFGNGENLVGGGVSVKLGRMSHRDRVAAENAELRGQVRNLQARMDALLSVINPSLFRDFPDVPANHWAYEAVSRLAGNDIIHGFEDGKYHGDQTMTRYQMAEIIYNALRKGAKAEQKLVEEFRPELQALAAQK